MISTVVVNHLLLTSMCCLFALMPNDDDDNNIFFRDQLTIQEHDEHGHFKDEDNNFANEAATPDLEQH